MDKDAQNENLPVSPALGRPQKQPKEPPEQISKMEETQPHQPVDPNAETRAVQIEQDISNSDSIEETRPVNLEPPEPAGNEPPPGNEAGSAKDPDQPPRRSWRWLLAAFLGLSLLIAIAFISGYGGYLSAIDLRRSNKATQVYSEAQRQFELGMIDLEAQRYDLARQRFEYVIQLNPSFEGVTEALAQALLALNTTATPTIAPTPTLSPTPDLRGQEDLYLQARENLAGGDWTAAIDTLLILRKRYPDYLTVEVDGLLYVALRNRGVQKISILMDLEGGTYDLALAQSFGPLDVEARNWRDWAILYVRGASFWDVDWSQAVFYFSQLAQIAPNLMDASRLTAIERYYLALVGYGDWFARQELWCEASEQYQLAANMRSDPVVQPTASFAAEQCANPTPEEAGGIVTLTPSPTPTIGPVVTLTPTPPGTPPTPTPTQAAPPPATPTPTQPPPATPTETQPPTPTHTPGGG